MWIHTETCLIFWEWNQLRLWLVQTHNIATLEDAEGFSDILSAVGVTAYTAPGPALVDYTESNRARLWQSAHDYEFQRISGSAIGMLTLGVLQQKPKCTTVAMWLKALWDDNYYPRKLLVTNTEISPDQLDFSNLGEIPYSIPELTAEVYAV